jgi:tetratricopeptide (TPR) repeat protein
MDKAFSYFRLVLIVISLLVCLFFAQNNLALVTSIKSNFSECEIQKHPPIERIKNLGNLNFPVSTRNPIAQDFFNQGITLFYSFNDEDAIRSFKRATELDSNFAMGYYGMALAVGSNINIPINQKCLKFASFNIQKAQGLSKTNTSNALEKELIGALATRYKHNDKEKQDENYAKSMEKVYNKYSNHPDVSALYADSLLNLHPWKLWAPDGRPAQPETNTIVQVLEKSLKAYPRHLGLNHYYIHAMEASAEPHKALKSANILQSLAPAAGHINHMPSHIYSRIGDYKKAAEVNEDVVRVDKPYVDNCKNISSNNCVQMYTGHYNSHNLLFMAVSYGMIGQFEQSFQRANEITNFVPPFLDGLPKLMRYLPTQILMLERFGRWDDILSLPQPKETAAPIQAVWHWCRAMAYLGKNDINLGKIESSEFAKAVKSISEETWGNNKVKDILIIPSLVLDAKINMLENKANQAIQLLSKAVHKQDNLVYDEPKPWFPVRETLGTALYQNKRYSKAEQVFRQDIKYNDSKANPLNPRSLFGLYKTLEAQRKFEDARYFQNQFNSIWVYDVTLKMSIASICECWGDK